MGVGRQNPTPVETTPFFATASPPKTPGDAYVTALFRRLPPHRPRRLHHHRRSRRRWCLWGATLEMAMTIAAARLSPR